MKHEDIRCYEGKTIKLLLKNGYRYTCIIIKFSEDSIQIKDKFGNLLTISLSSISLISEDKNA